MQATQTKKQLMIKGEFKNDIKVARILNGKKQVIFRFKNGQGASLVKLNESDFELAHVEFLDDEIKFEVLDCFNISIHESNKMNAKLFEIKLI